MSWNPSTAPLRQERHFDDRVVRAFQNRPITPYQAFEQALAARPQALALVVGEQRLSYAQLAERGLRVAAGLVARGVQPGDRVAMWLSNRLEFVTTLLGAWHLGAIVVPMGTRLQTPEVAYIMEHSGAKVLVHDAALATRLPALDLLPLLQACIAVGGGMGGINPAADEGSALESTATAPPAQRVEEDSVAAILYTSGTTGRPKGAMLTHLNLVHSMLNYQQAMRMGPQDRTLMAVPASHVTGLTANILLAWAAQCTLIVMPEFKVRSFLELAAREGMTQTVIVPAMYQLCLLQPDLAAFDLSSWRVGGYGGAPMARSAIEQLAIALPQLGLNNVYGSTETTGPVTLLPSNLAAQHPDSVGHVLPGAEIVVMDEQGHEVAPGASGELWIRGTMVVPGYWANPEGTKSSFVAGYWRSGDIGSIDAQGLVRVHDRLKDMLNRGGFKIYSVEVEHVLQQHPAVLESAIVGKPCQVLGERVHAFVCLKESAQAAATTAADLQGFCAERLADYKVPESYSLSTTPLPRNANGKLLKRELRAA
jgi:long-chain acyl-CoA synthetase